VMTPRSSCPGGDPTPLLGANLRLSKLILYLLLLFPAPLIRVVAGQILRFKVANDEGARQPGVSLWP
jgi:hypothetical protein